MIKEETEETSGLSTILLSQLYESTGGIQSYKGFILFACNENGVPFLHERCDGIVRHGLINVMRQTVKDYDDRISEFDFDEEDADK